MWWSEHREWCHPRDGDTQVMVTLDEGNNSDSQGWGHCRWKVGLECGIGNELELELGWEYRMCDWDVELGC